MTRAQAPPFPDKILIRRVSNGWIVQPGAGSDEVTHVYAKPNDLAQHVQTWAERQLK